MDHQLTVASLPLVLAGPVLRHCDADHFTLWFVTSAPLYTLTLTLEQQVITLQPEDVHTVQLGSRAWQHLIQLSRPGLMPLNIRISYQLSDSEQGDLFSHIPELTYHGNALPDVMVQPEIKQIMHGSCRNPHHHSGDALVAADTKLSMAEPDNRPAMLMMTGDQVYVDDIGGPMLYAIGQVIHLLGLPTEKFTGAGLNNSNQISYQPAAMYQRHKRLLPHTEYPAKTPVWHWYLNHPIFTSSMAENHLVSLSEMIALYLLIWSPELWQRFDIPKNVSGLSRPNQQRWQVEWQHLQNFKTGLGQVRRLLAHLPTYMMFDDHDITDDWNLTAKWEEAAYSHRFSRRIIGNALIGYTLFQGLGNQPALFQRDIRPLVDQLFSHDKHKLDMTTHNALIDALLKFEHWHYSLNTSPKVVVLDTRTRRWRSESNLAKPSGLMDWEALMDLQHELIGQDKVIIVSPAPMFGVKLIETVQRAATLIGASLMVDAENWMAHPGAANALLSIFTHRNTPQEFVILSGDVHYSFAYDVSVRFRHDSPHIYQITCSGFKNQFPEKLLPLFDKLNGWLYGYFSPLNLLTKRKRMRIRGRRPNGDIRKRLINSSGVGIVDFVASGAPESIRVLHADMSETLFELPGSSFSHSATSDQTDQSA
ncbi:metallophosphatase-binding domain protein [Shewanella sp. NFH-SH190041]|uniref:alkaline phosphatase D family protein n=1 Tax=Shewanella sp. NFH-SH190041 TaxID=2950245 RepID=UPI0021C342EC|nr:alkaline phosphatase D family protein [Shewanella sp. NFH-SH190041]BDM63016.1 metallophosphatase-binding domain protein [Shewanella sp. NFH-SH190041]